MEPSNTVTPQSAKRDMISGLKKKSAVSRLTSGTRFLSMSML